MRDLLQDRYSTTLRSPTLMRILVYSINFLPELSSTGKYTGEMATWLAAQGHDVRAVTAPPYYPEWKVRSGYKAFQYRSEVIEGVKVFRAPVWVPSQPTGAKRILHLLSFALASLPSIIAQFSWRPDVVISIEPPFACAPAALVFSKLCGGSSWLHIQDFELDVAFELGIVRGKFMRTMIEKFESAVLRRFDRVSTISGLMLRKAESKGVKSHNLVFFRNWVDIDQIRPMEPSKSPYRSQLGIPETAVVALYSGNMGQKQGLELLAYAAEHLKAANDIWFIFCGDGPGKAELAAKAAHLPRVRFLPLQPSENLNDLLGAADIHLLPQRADAADLVMPSKLTGMLASGKPVVATAGDNTELGQVVAKCGIVVTPGDAAAIASALTRLAADPESRRIFGAQARLIAENELSQNGVLQAFEARLTELIRSKRPGYDSAS